MPTAEPGATPEAVSVSALGGSGEAGFVDGVGAAATFDYPVGMAVDAEGNVLPERRGLVHRDSLGVKMTYNDGQVQWMTAGRGMLHEEMWETDLTDAKASAAAPPSPGGWGPHPASSKQGGGLDPDPPPAILGSSKLLRGSGAGGGSGSVSGSRGLHVGATHACSQHESVTHTRASSSSMLRTPSLFQEMFLTAFGGMYMWCSVRSHGPLFIAWTHFKK